MAIDDGTPPKRSNQSAELPPVVRDPKDFDTRVVRVPLSQHDHTSEEPSPSARFLAGLFDDDVWAYCSPRTEERATTRIRYVVDGKLWEAWDAPQVEEQYVRDIDLSRGQHILRILSEAYAVADRDVLDRLARVIDVLEDRPKTEHQKLVRYLDTIELSSRRAAMLESPRAPTAAGRLAPEVPSLEQSYVLTRNALVHHDHAFAQLDPKRLREALLMVVHDPLKKGGAGRSGPAHVAAQLAVEVNAFGFGNGDAGYDDKVNRARDRLQKERTKEKAGRAPTRRTR